MKSSKNQTETMIYKFHFGEYYFLGLQYSKFQNP